MDNDYPVDLEEVLRVIAEAEVLVLRFVTVPQRLLIDLRSGPLDTPLLALVPPVRSARERFESLKQLRPRFSPPERIVAIHWPRFVGSLELTGVWAAIAARATANGGAEAMVERAWNELRQNERRELTNAIRGTGYRTLWEKA